MSQTPASTLQSPPVLLSKFPTVYAAASPPLFFPTEIAAAAPNVTDTPMHFDKIYSVSLGYWLAKASMLRRAQIQLVTGGHLCGSLIFQASPKLAEDYFISLVNDFMTWSWHAFSCSIC
ncbi:Uncharacterized protein Fot_30611 [Forsythia ovata]|uniref:Uncharacterized protein n=1 Tax=Forsythia ovata TaxID=205694 RepID=A0ABD1T2N0_9LAMI